MKQLHIIEVIGHGPLKSVLLLITLKSHCLGEKTTIQMDNEPGSITPALDSAQKYLESIGYNIIGHCAGKDGVLHYLISDSFMPLVTKAP